MAPPWTAYMTRLSPLPRRLRCAATLRARRRLYGPPRAGPGSASDLPVGVAGPGGDLSRGPGRGSESRARAVISVAGPGGDLSRGPGR